MKDDRVYLWHIRDCIDRILDYTKDGQEAFLGDSKTQDAAKPKRGVEFGVET